MSDSRGDVSERARRVHREAPVLDLHSHPLLPLTYRRKDLSRRHRPPGEWWNPLRLQQDLPRAREGGLKVWTWVVYTPAWPLRRRPHVREARRQIALFHRFVADHPEDLVHARSLADVEEAIASDRIACLLAIEGGHSLGGDPSQVARFRALGCTYLTLVHFVDNGLARGVETPSFLHRHEPLTPRGREVVRACADERVILDVAHLTDAARKAVARATDATLVSTHTGARALCDIPRNLPDDAIREIARRGGLVGIISFRLYLERRGVRASIDRLVDHAAHVADLVGPEHVGIGTDFDGMVWSVRGLPDQAALPRLTDALLRRGFAEEEVRGILGGNALRVLRAAWDR